MSDILEWAAAQPLWVWPTGVYVAANLWVAMTKRTDDDEALARLEAAALSLPSKLFGLLERLAVLRRGSLKLPGVK